MQNNIKWIHFLGICGRGTAGIARVMKKNGNYVTGSDQGVYPPMSDYLDREQIKYFKEYNADHIDENMDLVVIGGNALHVDPHNVEVERARELGIAIIAWPELLAQNIMKDESVVVAGTYGKTTISALLVTILQKANFDPSYMIGESILGLEHNCESTLSNYSVVEGDEHPTLGYSTKPKFSYFPPKYLILTSALWDHANIYLTEDEFVAVFVDLVRALPVDGFIVADKQGKNLDRILENAKCRVIYFNNDNNKVNHIENDEQDGMTVDLKLENSSISLRTHLFGLHNANNILAASICAYHLGVDLEVIGKAIKDFRGIKGRLELKYDGKVKIYHDVGQHPGKARGAIEAIRWKFSKEKILVVLDPQASVLHDRESLNWYEMGGWEKVNEVWLSQLIHRSKSESGRVSAGEIVREIAKVQANVKYFPLDIQLVFNIVNSIKFGEFQVVLILSSGGWRGLWQPLLDDVKKI